jgi:hypothetical protein
MRRILVNRARQKKALKRGGNLERVGLAVRASAAFLARLVQTAAPTAAQLSRGILSGSDVPMRMKNGATSDFW